MLDTGEHFKEGRLGNILGDIGEQDGARRQSAGSPWRAAVGLAEIDYEERLAANDDQDETKEDEGDSGLGIVTVNVGASGVNVAHREQVKLLLASTARSVDGEEHGPSNQTSEETGNDKDFEEADKEIAVNRLVVENVLVLEVFEVSYPSKKARTGRWCLSLLAQMIEVRPRRVDPAEVFARDEEGRDKGKGENRSGNEGRDQAGERVGGAFFGLANFTTLCCSQHMLVVVLLLLLLLLSHSTMNLQWTTLWAIGRSCVPSESKGKIDKGRWRPCGRLEGSLYEIQINRTAGATNKAVASL